MTHNILHPTTSVSQRYARYGPRLQGYDLHQRSYSESQMVPRLQSPGQRQYSLRAHRVPPGPLGNNAVNQAISSSSTPQPGHPSGAPGRPPGDLTWKRLLSPAEPRNTEGTRIASLPPSREVSYVRFDAHDESDDSSDLRGTEGKPPVRLKKTIFSSKQFAEGWGRPLTVYSTSGRKYGWLGSARKSIRPLSAGGTI
jgi:hypothetical protein